MNIPAGQIKITERTVSVSTKYWTVVTISAKTVNEEHHWTIDNCKKACFCVFANSTLALIHKRYFLKSNHLFW